jgi:hypothetical protein
LARSFTIANLVTLAKQYADQEGQGFVADSEWQKYLSTAYAQLYSVLAASGLRYFETTQSLTAASTALPAGHMTTLGVFYVNGSQLEPLEELMFQDRHHIVGGSSSRAYFYELAGSNIVLQPAYTTGQTYTHYYIPQPTDYTSSITSTSVDVVTPDGEDFICWSMAARALLKQESEAAGGAIQERELARARVEEWAVLRQLHSQRRRVVDDMANWGSDPADKWR